MDLVNTLPDIRYWSKTLPFPPHTLTDLEVKVTDLECIMFNEMFISHQLVISQT